MFQVSFPLLRIKVSPYSRLLVSLVLPTLLLLMLWVEFGELFMRLISDEEGEADVTLDDGRFEDRYSLLLLLPEP